MTNEQLTKEVIAIREHQAKCDAEHEKYEMLIKEMQEEIKATKSLAEDVHIMAMNIEKMQKTLDDTNKKVDALTSKEFVEYKENKKIMKQNIFSVFLGAGGTFILGLIGWLIKEFLLKGGN